MPTSSQLFFASQVTDFEMMFLLLSRKERIKENFKKKNSCPNTLTSCSVRACLKKKSFLWILTSSIFTFSTLAPTVGIVRTGWPNFSRKRIEPIDFGQKKKRSFRVVPCEMAKNQKQKEEKLKKKKSFAKIRKYEISNEIKGCVDQK
jgi:hypothetical protein